MLGVSLRFPSFFLVLLQTLNKLHIEALLDKLRQANEYLARRDTVYAVPTTNHRDTHMREYLRRQNSRGKTRQQRPIDLVVAAVSSKIYSPNTIIFHRVHQTRHIRSHRKIISYDSAFRSITTHDASDGSNILVFRVRIFELDHHFAILEQLPWRDSAGIEDHLRHCRRHRLVSVGCGALHVCVSGVGSGVVDVVEEDAADGDVGGGVGGPAGVDVDVGGDGGEGAVRECGVDVAERVDVWEVVELGDAGCEIGVAWVGGVCAGAGVGVDDDEPVDLWVRFDRVEEGFPG